jgi:hypothetical protein
VTRSKKLIKQCVLAALGLGALVGMQAQAADIVYSINQTITGPLNSVADNPTQTDSVVGTLTTNGTIGSLSQNNIVSWNLQLNDLTNPANSMDLTTANSLISVDIGNVLSATATNLYFNFSGTGILAFQADNPGAYSGYHYWCLSNDETYYCYNGESIAPGNVYAGAPGDDLVVATGSTEPVGMQPLNGVPPPRGAPEPATLSLLGFGLAAAGFMRRRKGA